MFQSTEVRWFVPEPIPEIIKWFGDRRLSLDEASSRTDFYQQIGTDALGIKLREGQVECKKRLNQWGVHEFMPSVRGVLEEWHKWSFRIEKSDTEAENILHHASPGWIPVKKERIGIKAVKGNGWSYVPMAEFPSNGIQIEYTRITVSGQVYYSFCLESFGENKPDITTYPVGDITQGCTLNLHDSYSYPRLLIDLL